MRLAILHAVFPGFVALFQLVFDLAGEAESAEHVFDNVRYFFVLVDAAVGRAGEKPEPGHYFDEIPAAPNLPVTRREAADETVEVALFFRVRLADAKADRLA